MQCLRALWCDRFRGPRVRSFSVLLLTLTAAIVIAHLEKASWLEAGLHRHRHAAALHLEPEPPSGDVETAVMAAQDSARLDWVAPGYLAALSSNDALRLSLSNSINTVVRLAHQFNAMQPPNFADKPAWIVPNGDVHEYVSFAPYWWPIPAAPGAPDAPSPMSNASGEGSGGLSQTSTVAVDLQPPCRAGVDTVHDPAALMWKSHPYERRDGQVNPDTTEYGDAATLRNATRGAFFNAVSYALTGDESYATHMTQTVRAAFLDDDSAVRPRVRFGQIVRGPRRVGSENDWSTGTFRGLIEWREIGKLANAVLIMRDSRPCAAWTRADDDGIQAWARQYVEWMLSDPISLHIKTRESTPNNMVSFWYSQLIALHLLLGDDQKAIAYASEYFTVPFAKLIAADGSQPSEWSRTRPLHYSAFGLEAMMVNARMAAWAGEAGSWFARTDAGTTINDAVKFAMDEVLNAELTERAGFAPLVAIALSIYGDWSDGRYARYLSDAKVTGDPKHELSWRLFCSHDALTHF